MSQRKVIETKLRVRYAETDAMRVVYHANYSIWFEVGRGDYFRSLGQDYGSWERRGYYLPVSEVFARYHASARYGDLVTVHTWLEAVRSRTVILNYEVSHEASQQCPATGWIKHICVDAQGNVRRLPEELLDCLTGP